MFMMDAKVMSDREYDRWVRMILNPQEDLTIFPFLYHNIIITYAANGIQDIGLEKSIVEYMLANYSDEEIIAIGEQIEYANACGAYDFKSDKAAQKCLGSFALTLTLATMPVVNDIDGYGEEDNIIDVESTELLVDSTINPIQ